MNTRGGRSSNQPVPANIIRRPILSDIDTQASPHCSPTLPDCPEEPRDDIDSLLQTQPPDSYGQSDSLLEDSQVLLPSNQLLYESENQIDIMDSETATTNDRVSRNEEKVVQLSYGDLSRLLDTKLQQVAKTADVDEMRKNINKANERMSNVVNQVHDNAAEIANIKSAITELQGCVTVDQGDSPSLRTDTQQPHFHRPLYQAGATCREQERVRVKKYDKARKSLRIWPISGDQPDQISSKLRCFLKGALKYNEQEIQELGIVWVKRIRPAQRTKYMTK